MNASRACIMCINRHTVHSDMICPPSFLFTLLYTASTLSRFPPPPWCYIINDLVPNTYQSVWLTSCLCITRILTAEPRPFEAYMYPHTSTIKPSFPARWMVAFGEGQVGRFLRSINSAFIWLTIARPNHRHFHCKGWTLKRAMDECKVNG